MTMTNLIKSIFQAHPFHLVSPSPWPILTCVSLLSLTTSLVLNLKSMKLISFLVILTNYLINKFTIITSRFISLQNTLNCLFTIINSTKLNNYLYIGYNYIYPVVFLATWALCFYYSNYNYLFIFTLLIRLILIKYLSITIIDLSTYLLLNWNNISNSRKTLIIMSIILLVITLISTISYLALDIYRVYMNPLNENGAGSENVGGSGGGNSSGGPNNPGGPVSCGGFYDNEEKDERGESSSVYETLRQKQAEYSRIYRSKKKAEDAEGFKEKERIRAQKIRDKKKEEKKEQEKKEEKEMNDRTHSTLKAMIQSPEDFDYIWDNYTR